MTPEEIPGWFTPDEAEEIAAAALTHGRCGVLVETGTWCGRSAAMLADRLPDWNIHTIDPYPPYPEGYFEPGDPNVPRVHPKIMAAAALKHVKNVYRWTGECGVDPAKVASMFASRVNVLFVDGDHSEIGVRHDLDLWVPKLVEGGIVFLHDASEGGRFAASIELGLRTCSARSQLTRNKRFEVDSLHAYIYSTSTLE